jgi:hypothetical protein
MQMKIFELKTLLTKTPAANISYPKVAVQWLNQALYLYQSLCLTESESLLNRQLRLAANRCGQVKNK